MAEPSGFRLTDVRRPGADDRYDVTVTAGRVTAIVEHGARPQDPDRGPEIDADGRWLIPGLVDAHVHATQHALQHQQIDLAPAQSAAEAVQLLATALNGRGAPDPGEPVVGSGFRDGFWPDQPSKTLLDQRFGDLPVVMISGDLHCAWASSTALQLMGEADHPTGLLTEEAWMHAHRRLPDPPTQRVDALVDRAIRAAAARGLTEVCDFEFADNLSSWERRHAAGGVPIRVRCGIRDFPPGDTDITRGLRDQESLPGSDGLITAGPVKVFVDGSLNTRTALCHHPYPDSDDHGETVLDADGLTEIMIAARDHGLQIAVHAIGDRANAIALDCFARTKITGRIEHAQLVAEDDLPRFAELGVVASVQPWHAVDDWQVADHYWQGRTDRSFRYADLARSGAQIVFGSDAPVAPLDPWRTIAAAVDRSAVIGRSWHPEQQVGIADALRYSTGGRGAVQPGDPADLVLLDADPFRASTAELIDIGVYATAVGGRWVHGPIDGGGR